MATSRDLKRLLAILDSEGFGFLAGEILAEISAGRVVEPKADPDTKVPLTRGQTEDVADENSDDEPLNRVPIVPEDQLGEAITMLRFRLVEPARRLAEAERLAGELMDREAVRIDFRDDDWVALDQGVDRDAPGDERVAKALDELLTRIADGSTKVQV